MCLSFAFAVQWHSYDRFAFDSQQRDNLLTAIGMSEYGRQRKNVQLQIVRRSCSTESRAIKITTCWMNELSLCTTVHGSTLPSSMLIETCWRSGSKTIQSDRSETEASYVNTDTEHTHTLNAHIDKVSIVWCNGKYTKWQSLFSVWRAHQSFPPIYSFDYNSDRYGCMRENRCQCK